MSFPGKAGSITVGPTSFSFKAMGETRTVSERFLVYSVNRLSSYSINTTTTGWSSSNINDTGKECTLVAYKLTNESAPWTSVATLDCVKTTVGNAFYTDGTTHYDAGTYNTSDPNAAHDWTFGYSNGVPSGMQSVSGYPHYNVFKWIWKSDGTCVPNGHSVTVEAYDKICAENGYDPDHNDNFYDVVISNDLFGTSCMFLKLTGGQDYLKRGFYILYL